jgi:hypothetical protein
MTSILRSWMFQSEKCGLGPLSLRHLHDSSVERLKLWINRKANKYFGKKTTNKELSRIPSIRKFRTGADGISRFGRFL